MINAETLALCSDLFLIFALGFLGSFGHCAGMCSPIALAFSLQQRSKISALSFHLWLNLGRLLSYGIIGGIIGAIAEVLVASGQLAGIDSALRRGIAIVTGIFLIGFGLSQLRFWSRFRLTSLKSQLNSKVKESKMNLPQKWQIHNRIHGLIHNLMSKFPKNPLCLGITWGLMPCGFLYAAQIKAAETANLWAGAALMLAFGLGTLPVMVGIGIFSSRLNQDRLARLGGWLTIAIGIITLLRTGDTTVDYSGHGAMIFLGLALIARPIKVVWDFLCSYRRALGVGAFGMGLIHTLHMIDHSWGWNLGAVAFMLPSHQVGIWAGILAMTLMVPAVITSFDLAVVSLGSFWRQVHLLAIPGLVFSCIHIILIGSHYFGKLTWETDAIIRVIILVVFTLLVLLLRMPWIWRLFSVLRFYTPPSEPKIIPKNNQN